MTLDWISTALGHAPEGAELPTATPFAGFEIDSRRVRPGHCFVALSGVRADGHDYVADALRNGAAAAIVHTLQPLALAQWVVDSPEHALQMASAHWRSQFTLPLVGITGSNGKTTTRALTASVLGALGPICATTGNYNNHLGVPLSLSRIAPHHRAAVIEMGANHVGDIARLAAWARPTVGVITMAGDAHLEGFGSREAIARGKGELIESLPDDGIAILNADDPQTPLWTTLAGGRRIVYFGLGPAADVRAESIDELPQGLTFRLVTPEGSATVALDLVGRHNVRNALAAAAVGHVLGLDTVTIAARLGAASGEAGRLRVVAGLAGARVADDSYNANPDSVRAGLDWLAQQPGSRWAVLGAMAELGAFSEAAHRDVGAYAAQLKLDGLVVVGKGARGIAEGYGDTAQWVTTPAEAAARLQAQLGAGYTVLVKGSRAAGMEQVVQALAAAPVTGDVACSSH